MILEQVVPLYPTRGLQKGDKRIGAINEDLEVLGYLCVWKILCLTLEDWLTVLMKQDFIYLAIIDSPNKLMNF